MATKQDAITQVIIQVVIEATKAAMQEISVERAEACTRDRNEAAGMRPMIGGPSLQLLIFN